MSKFRPFSRVKNGEVFRVVKEIGRPTPAKGLFCKHSNSRSYSVSKVGDAIFALGDMCEVIAGSEKQLGIGR